MFPPLGTWEGHTLWRERGWESPNSDEGTYTVQCTLFIYTYFVVSGYGDPYGGYGGYGGAPGWGAGGGGFGGGAGGKMRGGPARGAPGGRGRGRGRPY